MRLILGLLLALPLAAQNIVIVMPYSASLVTWLQHADRRTPENIHFGAPNIERAGVLNRRMAFSHPWPDDPSDLIEEKQGVQWITKKLRERGVVITILRDGRLPSDWRAPLQS